ncbi:MAG: peptide deformylase, partial [Anaerolineae bacterium]|nr:peptide deformylase [Anaerolineae bacterium]
MALLPIVKVEHPILRKKAIKVTNFDKNFQQLVDDMIETMIDAPGVGLAAPQIVEQFGDGGETR